MRQSYYDSWTTVGGPRSGPGAPLNLWLTSSHLVFFCLVSLCTSAYPLQSDTLNDGPSPLSIERALSIPPQLCASASRVPFTTFRVSTLLMPPFMPRKTTYSVTSNASSPKSFCTLACFISVSLIVLQDRAVTFKEPRYTIPHS